jgi:hypothetical protein
MDSYYVPICIILFVIAAITILAEEGKRRKDANR